ncbi:MAG: glycoside hydrolase family 113, partial [Tannerellaceae bacterium]
MKQIKGFTWGWNYKSGDWLTQAALDSIDNLIECTNCDTIIIPIPAKQKTAHDVEVIYIDKTLPTKAEVERILTYVQQKGMRIILKAVVDCFDGTWRAYINFLSPDVICEPKWSQWFENYTEYVLYVSEFATRWQAEMVVIGCEMVCADAQEQQWRLLIDKVRANYQGLLTYNCDKYQEDRITWWDALDVISSSGYYPVG